MLRRIQESAAHRDRTRPLVWLHAPSVGEGLQARPILQALRAARPDVQIAYTYFSPSATTFAQALGADFTDVLPFDGTHEADTVLDAWQPSLLIFVKLDVWPRLVERARQRGVRIALASATLADGSGRSGGLARAVLHDAYAALDAVGAIDHNHAQRLTALGVPPARVQVTGDTRMDQVWQRAQDVDRQGAPLAALRATLDAVSATTLVAGSTWPADERALLPAFAEWRSKNVHARLVIAPHEPTESHLAPVHAWAAEAGLSLVRLSAFERAVRDAREDAGSVAAGNAAPWDVLLVDRVGILGALYALADIAFVGGGFHDAGLHSVLEPAAFGAPVLFGPRHRNASEAAQLVSAGAAVAVTDRSTLLSTLEEWSTNVKARATAGAAARAFVEANRGATERTLELLRPLMPPVARRP